MLNILLGQSLRSWYCRPWTVGSLPRLRKVERSKRTSKRRPSSKQVENRTPKLRLQQRPFELVHYCQHLDTSESLPCLPPTQRPCTWHPKSGPRAWEFFSPAAAAVWAVGTAPRRPSRRCVDWDSSARRDRRGAHRRVACREVRALER